MELTAFHYIGTRALPPDANVTAALASGHRFETALADLVDNSIDAGASHVHVRFVFDARSLRQIVVGDDGLGMGDLDIDNAMTLGRPKQGGPGALGHFGVGLKAASFSQAQYLFVFSRKARGQPQGRRLVRSGNSAFECDVVDPGEVAETLRTPLPGLKRGHGTFVIWDGLRHVPAGGRDKVDEYVDSIRTDATRHLGLVFHRMLDDARVAITFDSFDLDLGEPGPELTVSPIDPFNYAHSGKRGYPRTLIAAARSTKVPFECHVWPALSESRSFLVGGKNADPFQGLYVYRNDRLISYGGWHGVTLEGRRRRLARVKIEVESHLDLLEMAADKDSVVLSADLRYAISKATDPTGLTFGEYLAAAESVFTEGNKKSRDRRPMLRPGVGIGPRIRHVIADEVDFIPGEGQFDIRWADFGDEDSFLELDRKQNTLWLNKAYRQGVLGSRKGRLNDAPLVKSLLYLLFDDVMKGAAFGPRDKDNVALWNAVLTTAATIEESLDE